MTTPASTPAESTPTIAATAIQKSNRVTRRSRRSSRDVDHPEHDGVDDHRGEDRLRQLGEQRREEEQRQEDERAGDERRERRPRAGRLVQRARGEARRDGHALKHARRRRSPCPARRTPGRRRCGSWCRAANARASPAVCEKPISSSAIAATAIVARWSATTSRLGQLGRRQPARHVADERDAVRLEVEQRARRGSRRRRAPARPERRGQEAQCRGSAPARADPDDQRRRVHVAERADPRAELAPRVLALRVGAR